MNVGSILHMHYPTPPAKEFLPLCLVANDTEAQWFAPSHTTQQVRREGRLEHRSVQRPSRLFQHKAGAEGVEESVVERRKQGWGMPSLPGVSQMPSLPPHLQSTKRRKWERERVLLSWQRQLGKAPFCIRDDGAVSLCSPRKPRCLHC